jgi:hypothetical protein
MMNNGLDEMDDEFQRPLRKEKKTMVLGHCMDHMRNRHEALVIKAMEEALPGMESLCLCAMCTEDIFAISLNSIPASYQHSMSIAIHKKISYEEIREAVIEAAEKVKGKPKHS